jgi:hypothetical protein
MKTYSEALEKSKGEIKFNDLLLLAFIVLKLTGEITWSWWWVLAPFWGPFVLAFVLLGVYAMFGKKKQTGEQKMMESGKAIKSAWQERLEQMQAEKQKK